MRTTLRKLGLGRLFERILFRPTLQLRKRLSCGLTGAASIYQGESAMRAAASRRPAMRDSEQPAIKCSFLTGKRFWHQTAFCIETLSLATGRPVEAVIYDDGSLAPGLGEVLRRRFPRSRVVSREEADTEVAKHLPPSRYPAIHATRNVSIMMRKFVDQRAASRRWQLYLDSDILFFSSPEWLLRMHDEAGASCYMGDRHNAYLRPVENLDRLCGRPIVRGVNAGIVGMNDGDIDWDRVEHWCAAWSELERRGNVVEQTLTAMVLAWLPEAEPSSFESYRLHRDFSAAPPKAVAVHYVERGKLAYLASEWKRALASVGSEQLTTV